MRIETLTLERYGRFQDFSLDLSGSHPCLHIIHGANEAGKSTALSAICDLLFGIGARTPYGFAHGYDSLRIGATLSTAAGQSLTLWRRKGNRNTLLDASGAALPDDILAPFRGGLGREDFERRFGLDHERLRLGGDEMQKAEGDLARILFEAGSGLPGVVTVLDGLKADFEALGRSDRRAVGKPLWSAVAAYEDATRRMRADALHSEEWTRAVDALAHADALLDQRKAQRDALLRDQSRCQRLRRVLPILARLDDLSIRLEPLADGPDLPADFAEGWRAALANQASASARLEQATADLARQRVALEAIPEPRPLLHHATRIEELFRKSGEVASKREDRPKLQRDLQHSDARLAQLVVRLGGDLILEDLDRRRPSQPLVARVRAAIGKRGALEAARTAAADQMTAASEALAETEAALAALGQPVDAAEAAEALHDAVKAGDLETRLAAANAAAATAALAETEALARLGRWTGDTEALIRAPFPGGEAVQGFLAEVERDSLDGERLREALERTTATLKTLEGDLHHLEAAGTVPTSEAVAQARHHRDHGWRLIRDGYIDRTRDAAEAATTYAPETGDLPGAYEDAVRRADDLVDRLERDAHRVQRYRALQRQLADSRDERTRHEARLADRDRAGADRQARWLALWRDTGLTPGSPSDMLGWLRRRDEAVRAIETRRRAVAEVQVLSAQMATARSHLRRAGALLGLTDLDGLADPALRQRVGIAVERAQRTWDEARRLDQERSRRVRALDRTTAAAAAAADRIAVWTRDWAADMPALGLAVTATPTEAGTALEIWAEIETELVDRRQRRERLDGIDADLAAEHQTILGFIATLGDALPAEHRTTDPLALAPVLHALLKDAQALATRRAGLQTQLSQQDATRTKAQRQEEDARQRLSAQRAAHGLTPEADPLALATRAALRRDLLTRLDDTRRELAEAGDGLPEADLRAEAQGADPDAVAARAQALEDETRHLHQDLETAATDSLLARQHLDSLRQRAGIGEAAQQARDAALLAADHTARWVRLWAARHILEAAIERFRKDNEHPLVRRASDLFARVAGTGANPIERLEVAYGKKDQPELLGVRRDGALCPIDGMSDGTRDQLYLALRVAAIETAAATGEPMPFIADDLFITSDDQRTGAGLRILAELGHTTQVLLFTHHRQVIETARTALPPDTFRLHALPD